MCIRDRNGIVSLYTVLGEHGSRSFDTFKQGVEVIVRLPEHFQMCIRDRAEEGRRQLLQYSEDKVARRFAEGTKLHRVLLQFRGWDIVRCEEV